METPPPYYPPQKKKSNVGLIVGLILGGVGICCLGVIGLVVWGGSKAMKAIGPMVDCGLAFEDVRKAVNQYSDEHGGKLPPAETWQDDVRPYLEKVVKQGKDEKGGIFKSLDPAGPWGCKWEGDQMTGIAFNSDISGKALADIPSKDTTIMLFEIQKVAQNAHEAYKDQPNTAPALMGKPRPWIRVTVSGHSNMGNGKSSSGADFNFNFDDKKTSKTSDDN